ncbi:MAG: nucleoside triphosphate pyrophosphohydrolase [Bdellovibrionota bacterium]
MEEFTEDLRSIKALETIFEKLRDPKTGCPWEKTRTHETLKQDLVEETYEVLDALEQNDPSMLKEELGDLLLHIIHHTEIEREKNNFSIEDVIEELAKKLIRRHPHVFTTDIKANTPLEVLENWEKIKAKENIDNKKTYEHTLDKIPNSFPPFLRAYKQGITASRLGFDWNNANDVLEKISEELEEVKTEAKKDLSVKENQDTLKEEIGDLLYATIQYIRKLNFCQEEILNNACKKFKKRFDKLEDLATKDLGKYSQEEFDKLWREAKKI